MRSCGALSPVEMHEPIVLRLSSSGAHSRTSSVRTYFSFAHLPCVRMGSLSAATAPPRSPQAARASTDSRVDEKNLSVLRVVAGGGSVASATGGGSNGDASGGQGGSMKSPSKRKCGQGQCRVNKPGEAQATGSNGQGGSTASSAGATGGHPNHPGGTSGKEVVEKELALLEQVRHAARLRFCHARLPFSP